MAEEMGEPFADRYLWGATLSDGKLTPRTVTAWERLNLTFNSRDVLAKQLVTLVKPKPWGSKGGSQRSHTEVAPEGFGQRPRRRPGYDPF